jgi:hypothetical protein
MTFSKRSITLTMVALVCLLTVGAVAQPPRFESNPTLAAMDDARFEAFRPESLPENFNPRTDTLDEGTVFTLEIQAQRPDSNTTAIVQVSQLNFATARIDYLAPEELAGDVFIASRFEDSVVFWNEDLISPLLIDGSFEVFGDATVWEVMGIPFDRIFNIADEGTAAIDDGTNVLSYDLEAKFDRFPFSKSTVTADPETLQPITVDLFDQDGDPLHHNTFLSYTETEDGRAYYEQQLLENLIIPGNQTLLTVLSVDRVAMSEELFDADLLGL